MKKFLMLLGSVAIAMMFTGCGSPRMSVDPTWKQAPEKVTVLASLPTAENTDDVYDDFMTVDNFDNWFLDELDSNFAEYSVSEADIVSVNDDTFEMTTFPLGKGKITVPVPVDDKLEGVTGIVISVHPVNFWRDSYYTCSGYSCYNVTFLGGNLTYSIVSVADHRVLAYGVARDRSSFAFAMTQSDWKAIVRSFVRKILQRTPLEK